MTSSLWKNPSSLIIGATFILLGATAPSTATTLTGFQTDGSDMGGMQITVNFFNGTSQTATWVPTGSISGGAFGSGWSLTQSGNTFGSFNNPWNFTYAGSSSVAALIIDAIPGNTVFDILPDLTGPFQTPGSADGWAFQTVFGIAPTSYNYSVPIDISQVALWPVRGV